MSHALGDAVEAVLNATDGRGLRVRLCSPGDPYSVRHNMIEIASWFNQDSNPVGPKADEAALTNLILLATLLREYVRSDGVAVLNVEKSDFPFGCTI